MVMVKMLVMAMYLLPKNICEGAPNHKDDDEGGVDGDVDDDDVGDGDVPAL